MPKWQFFNALITQNQVNFDFGVCLCLVCDSTKLLNDASRNMKTVRFHKDYESTLYFYDKLI